MTGPGAGAEGRITGPGAGAARAEVRVAAAGGPGSVDAARLADAAAACAASGEGAACALGGLLEEVPEGDLLLRVDRGAATLLEGRARELEGALRSLRGVDAARVQRALRPAEWCAECHYDNCDFHLSDEVLALGRIVPTRGDQEKFCVSLGVAA